MSLASQTMPDAVLDQPLPADVSVQSASWFGRANNYPVFGPTWYRYRTQPLIIILLIFMVPMLLAKLYDGGDLQIVLVIMGSLGTGLASLCALGPGLAVLVRLRGWQPGKELAGLIAALLVGVLTSWGLQTGLEKLGKSLITSPKQTISVTVGVSAKAENATKPGDSNLPPKPASKAPVDDDASTLLAKLFGGAVSALVVAWLGGGLHLIAYFRQRRRLVDALHKRELDRAQAARREAELRLSVLAAQIEPHFLFNTLAGVRSAVGSDPARATAIIDHLVDYLRATIPQLRRDGGSSQARLGAQLEAARAYLGLMKARIPRLSFEIEVETGLTEQSLPPMMLISLVENAVKHGIEPKIGAGHIVVNAKRAEADSGSMLEVSVRDDGVGFGGDTSGSGIGLSNIDERLRELYGNRAALLLKAVPTGGVSATIRLPMTVL